MNIHKKRKENVQIQQLTRDYNELNTRTEGNCVCVCVSVIALVISFQTDFNWFDALHRISRMP